MTSLPWHVDVGPIRRWLSRMESDGRAAEAWDRVKAWDAMVTSDGVVNVSTEGRVGRIELCYPRKGNAFVPPMYRLLERAITTLAADDDVWVILITGAGDKFSTGGYVGEDAFYAGLDAGEDGTATEPMRRTNVELFLPVQHLLWEVEKPTVAMVNGLAVGEAVDLALCADIRIGHPGTELWFSFAYTGNTAYTGSAWLLPRLVGVTQAKRLLMTAARVGGEEAFRLGLLSELADTDELEARTSRLLDSIAALPPITLRLIKKEIHRGLEVASFHSNLDLTSMIETIVQTTRDHMDAEAAIGEKRPPIVEGR